MELTKHTDVGDAYPPAKYFAAIAATSRQAQGAMSTSRLVYSATGTAVKCTLRYIQALVVAYNKLQNTHTLQLQVVATPTSRLNEPGKQQLQHAAAIRYAAATLQLRRCNTTARQIPTPCASCCLGSLRSSATPQVCTTCYAPYYAMERTADSRSVHTTWQCFAQQ